jgi:hypothetical protein
VERPYFRAFGSGFAVFGFGLNVVLRVAPMIGWQPSYVAAVTLLALGFVCMAGGALMFVITVIPSEATVYAVFTRHWKPVVVWFFALLAFAFISWQSITVYKLRDVQQELEDQIATLGKKAAWRHLDAKQREELRAACIPLASRSIVIAAQSADDEASGFAREIEAVLKSAGVLIEERFGLISSSEPLHPIEIISSEDQASLRDAKILQQALS